MAELLELALSHPDAAAVRAKAVLDSSDDLEARSIAHQALGIVYRENGRLGQALDHLRAGVADARACGHSNRLADIRATLGASLVFDGRTGAGLRELDQAALISEDPRVLATVLMRRGTILTILGRHQAALHDLQSAATTMRSLREHRWLARTLNNLGWVQMSLGEVSAAEGSFSEAASYYTDAGDTLEALHTRMNVARAAFVRGSVARSLELYNGISPSDATTARTRLNLATDTAEVYLAAGLAEEAVRRLLEIRQEDLPSHERAYLHLALANARLAHGDKEGARAAAQSARTEFRRQKRAWFELRARLAILRAAAGTQRAGRLKREAMVVAHALHEEQAHEAGQALVLAGRLANPPMQSHLFELGSTYRHHPNALVRASGWLARCLELDERARGAQLLHACAAGLDALDDYRRTLGSSELRALATSHGRELAQIAIRHTAHDPRSLLRWSERWRATALAQPAVTSTRDVSPSLAILRENARQLVEKRAVGEPTEELERARRRLERAVRGEHHQRAGSFDQADERFDVGRLVQTVVDQTFVELVDVDGTLHVLIVRRGCVRRRVAGTVEEALELAERGRFALRRAARGGSFDIGDLGRRMQDVLLGDAVRLIPDGPVVIAPTVRLHGAPWALLPCLADRPFSLVPSAAQWLRARDVKVSRARPLTLIAGPRLGTGGAEVPRLKRRHPDAVLLRGKRATVEAALGALDGARLAHVAAHGHFRADSPLFSSLEMADGALTVYELERLKRAPYRLVLSACESGVLAPVGAEELLGLAAALFSLGTAGMVSSIAEVNDEITADLMLTLHEGLAAGNDPATALHAVRRAAAGDPTATATAAAFVALGV